MDQQQILNPGANVYGADGEKVGTMRTYGGAYIVVEKGFFFPKDYYIPMSEITQTTDDAVYLSVTKEDALHQGWDQAPSDATAADQPMQAADRGTVTQGTEYQDQENLTIPVHEERLEASKHVTSAGDVTVNKHVITQQETIEVPVTEERVRIDWREPTGEMTDDGAVFEEGSIDIPISREEVEVSKRNVETGEVQVTKERTQHNQKVTGEVRKEVVDVEDASGQVFDSQQPHQPAR